MFRAHPLLARILTFVALPILLAVVASYCYLRSGLPAQGTLPLPGPDGMISVSNGALGLTSIRASTDNDVFFAMGYVHARDRGWQMELQRRTAQGRLAEIFGEAALSSDIWFCTLGLYRAAQAAESTLSPLARASLAAYAAGVNAWYGTGAVRAPEMLALDVHPDPWQLADSLAVMKLVALSMAGGMQSELQRAAAFRHLTQDQARTMYGEVPAAQQAATSAEHGMAVASDDLLTQLSATGPGLLDYARVTGSNAWVISGKLSANHRPILANDPHMALGMPAAWYVVKQSGPTLHSQGMSLVGMPLVIFGKNRDIVWGGTNMMADTQDLYLEQPQDGAGLRYRNGKQWQAFGLRQESIQVAPPFPNWLQEKTQPVRFQVRETERGPVISDALPKLPYPMSLQWTALDRDDTSYEAFFRLNYARDWQQFRAAMALHVAPVLNMLYADDQGNIGYLGAGRLPMRATGNGEVPRPGWSGEFRWTGYVPAARMPALYNPAAGYIVSANHQMAGVSYPDFVTLDWAPPYRAQRIEQMIHAGMLAGHGLDLVAQQAMQHDVLALDARDILPYLLKVAPVSEQQRQALQLLRSWDGGMRTDSAAAAIYTAWSSRLREVLLAPKLSIYRDPHQNPAIRAAIVSNLTSQALQRILSDPTITWCVASGCRDELQVAFSAALRDLSKLLGKSPQAWRLGEAQHVRLQHTPFGRSAFLGPFFERRFASGGGPNTVNVAIAHLNGGHGYEQSFGAVFRQVIAPGDGAHYFMNSSGQSGNPLSEHYADMTALYASGEYRLLAPDAKRVHQP